MERSRWLCLQHRLLQAEKGLLLDTSSKGRRPKVGGGFLRPQNLTNRHRMCNHFQCFCRGSFSRFGASLEGSKTSALQREHVLEQPEAQTLGQRCSGSTIRNERKRGNEVSAAAGTRFGRSGSPKMRPAPQREQHFEKNTSENPCPGNPVCKKTVRGGGGGLHPRSRKHN